MANPVYPGYQPLNRESLWAALFAWLESQLTAPGWQPSAAYAQGAIVTDPQGHLQVATIAGSSGAVAPAWNDTGGETVDGNYGAGTYSGGGYGNFSGVVWQDTGAGFVSMGRKHIAPPDLTIANQPALFQVVAKEMRMPQKMPGVPNRVLLRGWLILYVYGPTVNEDIGAETVLGETLLNNLLLAIDTALAPDNPTTGKFTLGGLVTHCWIEGDGDLDPGIFGPQAAAILPINIQP